MTDAILEYDSLRLAMDLVECKIHVKKVEQKNVWKTQHMLYFWKAGGSSVSNIFNSSLAHSTRPHNAKKLFSSSF